MNKITGNKYFTSSCEAGVGEIILRLSAWAYKRFSRFRWPNISNFLLTLPKNFRWKVQDLRKYLRSSTGKWRIGQVLENNVKKTTQQTPRIGLGVRVGGGSHYIFDVVFILYPVLVLIRNLSWKKLIFYFNTGTRSIRSVGELFLRGWGGGRVFNSFSTIWLYKNLVNSSWL